MKKLLKTWSIAALSLVCITTNAAAAITAAESYNQRKVQAALNTVALTDPAVAAQNAIIETLSVNDQREALDYISGEQYCNLIQANQVASQQFMRRMYDSVRFDCLGLDCGNNCDQFNVWSAIGGGRANQKNSHSSKGYKLYDWNIAAGAYKPLNICLFDSWLTVGLAGSYERDHITFKQGGRGHGDNWQGALYYIWTARDFYSFSTTILGADQVFVKRPIRYENVNVKARSRARFTQWTSYSEIGYNFCYESVYVQPFAGIEYAWYRRHALSEHGSSTYNLHVKGKNVSATIGRLGFHLTTNLPCWGIVVAGDLAYRVRLNFLTERVRSQVRGNPDTEFRVQGPHQRPNGFEGALSFAKCFCNNYQAYVEFAGEAWKHYSAWNASFGVNASF